VFERLGKSAKAAIISAQMEAATMGQGETADEHLLLGCLAASGSRAASLLRSKGVTRPRLIDIIDGLDHMGGAGLDEDDARALSGLGIDLEEVIRSAEEVFGPGAMDRAEGLRRRGPRPRVAGLGPAARRAISQSVMEAIVLGDRRVEVEHLLAAVLHDPTARCAAVAGAVGLDYDSVREQLNAPPGTAAAG
jgi:ATP-dependent Clp protease ATP-binding subunit ClpA